MSLGSSAAYHRRLRLLGQSRVQNRKTVLDVRTFLLRADQSLTQQMLHLIARFLCVLDIALTALSNTGRVSDVEERESQLKLALDEAYALLG